MRPSGFDWGKQSGECDWVDATVSDVARWTWLGGSGWADVTGHGLVDAGQVRLGGHPISQASATGWTQSSGEID